MAPISRLVPLRKANLYDGTKRFILNLKQLKKFNDTNHFKMEDTKTF